ncbi:hypothetical protein D3C86_2018110 [compost metagenome]
MRQKRLCIFVAIGTFIIADRKGVMPGILQERIIVNTRPANDMFPVLHQKAGPEKIGRDRFRRPEPDTVRRVNELGQLFK